MTTPSSTKPNKRSLRQPHLTLFYEHFYRQLPVMTSRGPLVEEYLERLHEVVLEALRQDAKVFAARVDLRFPTSYWPLEGDILSNAARQRFLKILRRKLDRHQFDVPMDRPARHPHHLRYVWAREYDQGDNKPHFHLLLLFNGHAFSSLGDFNSEGDNLYKRISESWAEALGLPCLEGDGLVHFPENGQYRLSRGDEMALQQLFYRASYLTKEATKHFNDGCHPFGVSRSLLNQGEDDLFM